MVILGPKYTIDPLIPILLVVWFAFLAAALTIFYIVVIRPGRREMEWKKNPEAARIAHELNEAARRLDHRIASANAVLHKRRKQSREEE